MMMEIVFLNDTYLPKKDCVATIGFFDGVHKGHRFLIKQVTEYARRQGLAAAVITFDRHPREVLNAGNEPKMLSSLDERFEKLEETGLDYCFVVPFNQNTSMMSAHDFMKEILKKQLNVRQLVIGYDNRFGHNRTEGFDDYVRFGSEIGMQVTACEPFVWNDVHVSSSVIRHFLSQGAIEQATQCLGYPYSLTGSVENGEHEGRKIGFPTANIHIDNAQKLIPQQGVYAVEVRIDGEGEAHLGMMNIGKRPTFGYKPTTIEVHLLDFEGNLYGKRLSVSFIRRLREERPFSSPELLAEQLKKDEEEVRKAAGSDRRNDVRHL